MYRVSSAVISGVSNCAIGDSFLGSTHFMSKLIIERLKHRERYGILDMSAIEDERLSLKGRGLLIYLVSRPQPWNISIESIAAQLKDGRDSVQSAFKELETLGYLEQCRSKGTNGQPVETTWTVYEVSQKAAPPMKSKKQSGKYQPENPVDSETITITGKQAPISKVVSISAYQPENPDDGETRSMTYQPENPDNIPYQPENPDNRKTAACRSTQGVSYQPENPVALTNNYRNKKEHSSAPDKPALGKKSSSKKSPTQSSGQDVPGEVYALMDYLKAAKKAQGVTDIAFDGRWRGVSKTAGKAMLESGLSVESVKDAIDWLVNSPFYGPGILSLYDVKQKLHVYQTQSKAVQSRPQVQATGTYGANDLDSDEIDRALAQMLKNVEGAL